VRAVVQRTGRARVSVGGRTVGAIDRGFLVFVGVSKDDTEEDGRYLAEKISGLRVFEDEAGKMNLSLSDVGGEVLVVSQFTLFGDCRKGRRPSFVESAPPEPAEKLYRFVCDELVRLGHPVATGQFRAEMAVELVNEGPVTLLLDSKRGF